MNSINEFDRALGQWLDEGPNRSPDRPIELAVDHARSHPRRRDPLGFLRPDPMGRRSPGLPLRPVMILAALGLLLGAIVALGVGSQPQPAIVVSPSPSQPSASPTPSTSAGPPVRTFDVLLTVPQGQPQTVAVTDRSGLVVEAVTGTPTGEAGQSFAFDSVEATNLDATTLQLGWAGFPCETDHTLTIESDGRTMTLERPACAGDTDTIGVDRILILRFATAVAAGDVAVTLMP